MNKLELWHQEMLRMEAQRRAMEKPSYFDCYDEYVKHFPEYKDYGTPHWVEGKTFIATYEGHGCVPGGYLLCQVVKQLTSKWSVSVNDGDDGYMIKFCDSMEEAQRELDLLKVLAPFYMEELRHFGYSFY